MRSPLQLSSPVTVSSSLLYVFLITLLILECRLFVVTSPYFLPLGIPQLAPYFKEPIHSFSLLFLNHFLQQNLSIFFSVNFCHRSSKQICLSVFRSSHQGCRDLCEIFGCHPKRDAEGSKKRILCFGFNSRSKEHLRIQRKKL